jgi:hypothetical protein
MNTSGTSVRKKVQVSPVTVLQTVVESGKDTQYCMIRWQYYGEEYYNKNTCTVLVAQRRESTVIVIHIIFGVHKVALSDHNEVALYREPARG